MFFDDYGCVLDFDSRNGFDGGFFGRFFWRFNDSGFFVNG